MHIHNPVVALIRTQHQISIVHVPILRPCHRINRNLPQIRRLRIHQIFQRLRGRFLVQSVIVYCLPHHRQIGFQRRFPRALHRTVVPRRRDSDQNKNDGDDDHQFDQREPSPRRRPSSVPRHPASHPEHFIHAAPSITTTSSSISSRRWQSPVISSIRRRYSFRPSSSSPDHPGRRAAPTPSAPSSDPSELAAKTGSCGHSPRQAARPSPAFPNPEDNPRFQLRSGSSYGPPNLYTGRWRRASAASRSVVPFLAYGRSYPAQSAMPPNSTPAISSTR